MEPTSFTIPYHKLYTVSVNTLERLGFIPIDWEGIDDDQKSAVVRAERARLEQWYQQKETKAVDAAALSSKLNFIKAQSQAYSSPPSRASPSSCASDDSVATLKILPDQFIDRVRSNAAELYQELIEMGGRPTLPIADDPGPCPPFKSLDVRHGYCLHCSDYWSKYCILYGDGIKDYQPFSKFRNQRWTRAQLRAYKAATSQLMRSEGIKWNIDLEVETQSKLDEWKQFYLYWLRRLRRLEQRSYEQDCRGWTITQQMKSREAAILAIIRRLNGIQAEFPKIARELSLSPPKSHTVSRRSGNTYATQHETADAKRKRTRCERADGEQSLKRLKVIISVPSEPDPMTSSKTRSATTSIRYGHNEISTTVQPASKATAASSTSVSGAIAPTGVRRSARIAACNLP